MTGDILRTMQERVVATSLADEIAFRLQAAIIDGEFAPGTHLQQDELCARFGVSRTPVREALRKLQAQHLVDLIPNRGAMTVSPPTRTELREVYELRAELEGYAAERAATRITCDTLAKIDDAQTAVTRLVTRGPLTREEESSFDRAIRSANEAFHGAIHEAADSARLRDLLVELQRFFPKDHVWRAVRSSDEALRIAVDEHLEIRAALAEGDALRARRAMSAHVEHAGAALFDHLDSHGFWR
jgi:DNA-binding GntR family transcriptional regulator